MIISKLCLQNYLLLFIFPMLSPVTQNMRFLVSNASKWLALTYDELQGTTIRSSASSITERNTKLCAASPPEQMLPHLINLRRVRATLSQIPIWDTLYPPSEVDVERRFLVDIDSHVDHKSDDAQGDPKSETDSDSSVSSDRGVGAETAKSKSGFNKTRVKSFRGGKTEKKYKEEWKNGGCDIRYSLSFLMPLVLAVLDTCNLSNGNVSNDGLVAFNCDREESLARLCQCLCEKGGLALSLASLSSQCPLVRQAAIGILGLVLRSLETAQSSNNPLTKWSATPQLRMLLHSVQLGVSLRRISQLERRKIGGEKGSHAVCLPMLPAVSALFLARSSLVLMHPDDIMYSSINAYFLRLSSKGAFRDTSRVPGFISLFCPTDDKEGNAKSARLWALQLLKDGMIDKFCFKAATRCHAPSLLLSSFDTFAATCSSTKEVEQDLMEKILLLRTLTKMLESGGPRAVNHFIRNLGLLSWIKVILLSQKKWPAAGSSVNAIQLRIEVVSLVCTAVVQAETDDGDEKEESRSHHRQWLYTELSSLPGAIIDFFMETTTVSKNDATNTKTLTMKMAIDVFCRLVGDCIWIVKEAIDNVVDSGEPLRLWASTWGVISLDGACALLKHKALDKKMKMKIAWALCVFPYRHYGRYHENVGTGGTSALLHDFGAAVTTTILNLGNDCGDDSKDDGVEEMIRLATPVILERIRNLWRTSYNVCAIGQCDDVRLLYNMLLLRSNAVLLEGGTRLWNAAIVELMSIKEVVPEVGSEIEATRLAFDACLHNQEKIASFSAAALDQQQG